MEAKQRVHILKMAAGASVALLLVNVFLLDPALERWKAQSERMQTLRLKVGQGRQLLERQTSIREHWRSFRETDLPEEVGQAENEVFRAVGRWGSEGRLTFTALNPQWRTYAEGYATLECRATAVGDQAGIARFLQALETDSLAVRVESCEISAGDKEGRQLHLTIRFSAVRLLESAPRKS